ncbi:MAG TPA: transglycosylase domain-containing protein, partial [Candidatus Lustribacter sp.]|nr:transglycosylase domain-containing protein [Candidatus Lustribacter sp.]
GVSPSGIARAVIAGIKGGAPTQGGSTITQQYVKNYFLTQDRTVSRKFNEIIISLKIDGQETKAKILENYLNTIYYGRGAYGVQTASRAYFNKDVSRLTVAEGAVLASVIRAPSLYDPALGAEQLANLKDRFTYVLDGMVGQGWLSSAERAAATFPKILPAKRAQANGGTTGYIIADVKRELEAKLKLTQEDIERGGLRVVTTIDRKSQAAAVAAVEKTLPTDKSMKDVYAGLVAIRPGDGAIVAEYGGKDFITRETSSATGAILQGGSTFKPFALIAALQQGLSTKSRVDGSSPYRLADGKSLKNAGNASYGMVDLRYATGHSINTAFLRLNEKVGPDKTRAAAIAAGVPESTPGLGTNLTNVLGTASPHVVDMANAFATIAAQGRRATPYLIRSVTSAPLELKYTAKPVLAAAFSKDVAADVIDAMTQPTKSGGTASRARELGRPVAGKTGTTDSEKSVWFTGYVPQLSVSVGMFKDVNGTAAPLHNVGGYSVLYGGTYPLSIWLAFMDKVMDGVPEVDFPERAGIGDDQVKPVYTPRPSTSSTTAPPTTPPVPSSTTTTAPTPSSTSTTLPAPGARAGSRGRFGPS